MAYLALEVGQAGNSACPNQYNAASTLLCQRSTRLILQISKEAIFLEFGKMEQGRTSGLGGVTWQGEIPLLAGTSGVLHQDFDAVRVRNYKAGEEAEVLLSAESV
jgi:hypothetical protein